MAKAKSMPVEPDHDDWQTRDDVHQLMRTDDLHRDPKRMSRAVNALHSTAARYPKKRSRSEGRKSGR